MGKSPKGETNELWHYLEKRSINKAEVCRKTGIHPTRMSWICSKAIKYLRASELQLIALAIKVNPADMLQDLLGHLELIKSDKELSVQEKLNLQVQESINALNLSKEDNNFDSKDIDRIAKILPFCAVEKSENEIMTFLNLQRKSPNFNLVLKICVQVNWLKMKQDKKNGGTKMYTTTDLGTGITRLDL